MRAGYFKKTVITIALCLFCFQCDGFAIGQTQYVGNVQSEGNFPLAQKDKLALLYVDEQDYAGVIRAVKDLQADIQRVTNRTPAITSSKSELANNTVIIGTIGKSPVIDELVRDNKIDVTQIKGKWESFLIQVVSNPLAGVESGLIIAGSDKRGTIYGIYNLSEQIGVSPWYWWADVPVEHKDSLFVKAGKYIQGPPAVKYRGIFINDEGWALAPCVREKFGGFNSKFYTKVFELLLRLKGNFLWPAMWGNAFNEDDPNNPRLADEYGIVMGNSHQEPMLRAQKEWDRRYNKSWDYWTDADNLQKFWREGVSRNKNYESIISMGLRGANDTAMAENKSIQEIIDKLQEIINVQRKIIAEEVNPDVAKVPQLWCPYKETQEYYEKGVKIPDDITILWCDDNWGNIRRLPTEQERKRSGGAGIYYHFDFHGGPRSYEWLNTNPIPRIWEQMHLAYRHGDDRIWIVNVGDIKPMEFPLSFFIDYAWNPERWSAERLPEYTKLWVQEQFGPEHAAEIADIINKYTKYNGRRKPEMLSADTYNLSNYREAETVVDDYNKIADKAEEIYNNIPAEYKDAYYQLVLYPTKACANLNELYLALGKNLLYAKQGRAETNDMAEKVKELFEKDAELSNYYNKDMAGGKWNHMMDTTHIGYRSWNPPRRNAMPRVQEIDIPEAADMGVAIEGSDKWWPAEEGDAILPEFDPYNRQNYYIEVFNRGQTPFDYQVQPAESWLIVTPDKGKIEKQQRLWVSVDWQKVPAGTNHAAITISGPDGKSVSIQAVVKNPESPKPDKLDGFVESNGFVSMEAEHYTKAIDAGPIEWLVIPDIGRTLSGVTPVPVTADRQSPKPDGPHLEYDMYLFSSGEVKVNVYICPTQNFLNTDGLHYAVSFDDQEPQMVNIHENETVPDWKYPPYWNQAVSENIKVLATEHHIDKPGEHVLKFWMVDPGIVLQKIVVDTGGLKPSYFGPPESFFNKVSGILVSDN